ncbi:MAG: hypothetical protein DRQ55_02010 [Planctomycetota bacterium]|nr:MAG: hypothetical protein DRQ55_02010 [Planctomycetota bacterium]
MSAPRALLVVLAFALLSPAPAAQTGARSLRFGDPADEQLQPFFDGPHAPGVPSPRSLLGQPVGTRLAHHAEIVALWRLWEASSERVRVEVAGRTHEGREMLRVIITSPANHARLGEIRAGLQQLTDPRDLSGPEAERLLDELPAVAWLGYSIHGDELSGADAGLAVGWHLAAGSGADVTELMEQLVVVIDPCMNPDGRERSVAQVEQLTGYVPNLDHASMQRGRWPWGRGNHYLFDMNRDWMTATQPETRARWASARDLPPQLFVDAHEMGSLDSFLMYPQAAPHNPYLPARLERWHQVFARDAAEAFDRQGWSYYTREWADAWGPFYSDAWASLSGAVGILYEQARTSGFPLRNAQGRVLTYREAVQHQVTASMANLTTAASHRRELLSDYLENFRAAVDTGAPGHGRMLALLPGRHPSRERELLSVLLGQSIEVRVLDEHLQVTDAVDVLGQTQPTLDLPPGTWLVPVAQPYGALVRSFLSFDVRMDLDTLRAEREDLERTGVSRMYDTTAWSVPLQYDLEAWWCDDVPGVGQLVSALREPVGELVPAADAAARPVAWVVDGGDDASVVFATRAMERGLVLSVADEAFESAGRSFARGSVVVRVGDNDNDDGDIARRVAAAAREARVSVFASGSGRAPGDGADLGGGHFGLLTRPRVAMVSGDPVHTDAFGHLWHVLDTRLGVPVSFLEAGELSYTDLRPYNVLVLPPGSPVGRHAEALGRWVDGGGTLIAVGGAAGAVASSELSEVTRRRDALDELDGYAVAARREASARDVQLDLAALWGDPAGAPDARSAAADEDTDEDEDEDEDASGDESAEHQGGDRGSEHAERHGDTGDSGDAGKHHGDQPDTGEHGERADADDDAPGGDAMIDPDDERQDAWMRRFSPAGVLLRGLADQRHWLTAGMGPELPVLVSGSTALLSRQPVDTLVRLSGPERLRLAGLLWPEASERLAHSAWATVESRGQGQVILMAQVPGFRGQFLSGARMFSNAVIYGPGLGARQPVGW